MMEWTKNGIGLIKLSLFLSSGLVFKMMFLLQRFLGRFLGFVLRLYFETITVRGDEHVPRKGGVILAGRG